jgi:hypothetical protein
MQSLPPWIVVPKSSLHQVDEGKYADNKPKRAGFLLLILRTNQPPSPVRPNRFYSRPWLMPLLFLLLSHKKSTLHFLHLLTA